jgi:hypothetical protein
VWHDLLRDPRFFDLLYRFDQDLADQAQAQGCPCGGRLDRADYPRKPRGGPTDLSPDQELRRSFCCHRDGCRSRTTPPSLRFLGRRVYLGVAMILLTAMTHSASPGRVSALRADLGVDRRTLARWQRWWREDFPASRFWREHRSRLSPALSAEGMPGTLLDRFAPQREPNEIVSLLRFLAPI